MSSSRSLFLIYESFFKSESEDGQWVIISNDITLEYFASIIPKIGLCNGGYVFVFVKILIVIPVDIFVIDARRESKTSEEENSTNEA